MENTPTSPQFSSENSAAPAQSIKLPAAALLFQAPDLTPAPRIVEIEQAPKVPAQHAGTKNHPSKKKPQDPPSAPDESNAPSQPDDEATDSAGSGDSGDGGSKRRRRGGRGRKKATGSEDSTEGSQDSQDEQDAQGSRGSHSAKEEPAAEVAGEDESSASSRRRRTRSRTTRTRTDSQEVSAVVGSTRLEAKRQRRREGREAGRRRPVITESEFLARRESVDRTMLVREQDGLNQIAVLEDGVLVEHYVARRTQTSMVGSVYLGKVQNVLPSMEAAFVDLGRGRNAVLYAGEVNWDAAGLEGKPRRIESALKSGDTVLVQVTKDPIGQKGARLTSQITLAGRHLVLVPSGAMTGISRKLPEAERARLKKLLKQIVPDSAGVIVRTAAEGATEEQLRNDVERLLGTWEDISKKAQNAKGAPLLLKGEPELAVRVVRDVFNEDFSSMVISGSDAWKTISAYVQDLSPELADRMTHWVEKKDLFSAYRVDEQLSKGMDRKVWLPSGGSLVIDRTEAMTVVDVNTGRFTGSGGSLEETVTRNNLEAAEEIVNQLRLRDIGGIIVIDFIDMVLESNRDLVMRRLIECLGRDRTRHQVAEVTSLGLVQMTRKRVGQGLVEAFSETCAECGGRGIIVHAHPVERSGAESDSGSGASSNNRRRRGGAAVKPPEEPNRTEVKATLQTIAAAAAHAHEGTSPDEQVDEPVEVPVDVPEADAAAPESQAPASADSPQDAPTQGESAPSAESAPPRKRRRVVATSATASSSDAPAIISLPAVKEPAQIGAGPSRDALSAIKLPERAEGEAAPKRSRRATSHVATPPPAE
ncbi:MAG: Rne/Rng family ribonuclease [Ruaniaceae bacterium]|nr:Rne/Rng family ribonuclease [Ruaniaceae bacterium]